MARDVPLLVPEAHAPVPKRPASSAASDHRILVDLSHAADGHVGIAQDIRTVFAMLHEAPDIAPAGLLMPTGRHDLPRVAPRRHADPALANAALHWMARNWSDRDYPMLLGRSLRRLIEAHQVLRGSHRLLRLDDPLRSSAVWRVLFARSLPPDLREPLLRREFHATDLSVLRIIDRANHLSPLPPKRLDARGFDSVLFSMPRPVRLPPGVRQLIRFHDAVPVTDPDTVSHWRVGAAHQRLVRACARDAIFVCNSPQSRDDLCRLDPAREAQAVVIPCALPPRLRIERPASLSAIVADRRCWRGLEPGFKPSARKPIQDGERTPFLLAVSTLEPRKNYPGLVRAWERVARRQPQLRLVIVANGGWSEGGALAAIRPHIATGAIVHLEQVPPDELDTLMRAAACLVFPSFNEGFGYPPLEALAAGTPAVVADIPVLRWTLHNAALFADPYDVDHIAAQIERLVCDPDREALRTALRRRQAEVLERFSTEAVAAKWAALLHGLCPGEKRRRPGV